MKLKINSFHLICIILVQILMIDLVLIGFLARTIAQKPGEKTVQASNKQKASSGRKDPAEPVLSKAQGQAPLKVGLSAGRALKKDILLEVYQKINFIKTEKSELKVADRMSGSFDPREFIATSYDLSYESCGKYPGHPAYGITFSGKRAVKGRTVAVDPEVIPLGSRLYIEFPEPYTRLNGWYVAEDTGNMVKGNIIDVFLGESAFHEMEKFGSRKVRVRIIYPESLI